MKKYLHLLLILSVTISFSATKTHRFSDQTAFVSSKQDTVTAPVKYLTVANTTDPIVINFLDVDISNYPSNFKDNLYGNLDALTAYFTTTCLIKFYNLNAILLCFNKSDIAYPFHTHL